MTEGVLYDWVGTVWQPLPPVLKTKFIEQKARRRSFSSVARQEIVDLKPGEGKYFGPLPSEEIADEGANKLRGPGSAMTWPEGYAVGSAQFDGQWYTVIVRGRVAKDNPHQHAIL